MSRKILLVGGTHGIGKAIVDSLLLKGDEVITIAKSPGATYSLDITDVSLELPNLEDALDGLVYCPGTVNLKPCEQISVKEFTRDWEINVLGAFRTVEKYLKNMRRAQSSSMLFFSSVVVKVGMPLHTSIASAKGGLEGMALSLAAELAPKIRVNVIAPSLVDTPLVESLLKNEQARASIAKRHPLGRIGTPKDIASMALFLLSEEASWITGQVFGVDGGMSTIKLF